MFEYEYDGSNPDKPDRFFDRTTGEEFRYKLAGPDYVGYVLLQLNNTLSILNRFVSGSGGEDYNQK